MATFKLVLSHHKRNDGMVNIRVRLTHNRDSQFISTKYYIDPKQFKKGTIVNNPNLDIALTDLLYSYKQKVIKMGSSVEYLNCKELKRKLIEAPINLSYTDNAQVIINDLKEGATKVWYQSSLNSFNKFAPDILITEINSNLLKKYERFLESNNIIPESYLRGVRATFNLIRDKYNDEDTGNILIPNNPFKKYKIPKSNTNSREHVLTVDELRRLRDFNGTEAQNFAKDMFMLMFYLIGIEAKDLFYADLTRDRLEYTRFKTKKHMSIKIEPEAREIIDRVEFKHFTHHKIFLKKINQNLNGAEYKNLKGLNTILGIDKNITSKWSRHTWATIARNECNISKDDVSMALGHSFGIAVTDIYIKPDYTLIDSINRKVLDYIKC